MAMDLLLSSSTFRWYSHNIILWTIWW